MNDSTMAISTMASMMAWYATDIRNICAEGEEGEVFKEMLEDLAQTMEECHETLKFARNLIVRYNEDKAGGAGKVLEMWEVFKKKGWKLITLKQYSK